MRRASSSASNVVPCLAAAPANVALMRSVSNSPGSRLLIVTPLPAMLLRAMPATKPVKPLRAPLDSPSTSIGALTALEVMLTMRPKPRPAMPSTVALISSIGVSMLASSALIQAARSHSRKSPGGGPPALVTTMSKSRRTENTVARPSSVVISAGTAITCVPDASANSVRSAAAVASSSSAPRATISTFTPSLTSACAQPAPRPLLAPHTSAHLFLIPKSMTNFLIASTNCSAT